MKFHSDHCFSQFITLLHRNEPYHCGNGTLYDEEQRSISYYWFGEGKKYKMSSKPWIPSEFEKNFWCGDVQAVLRGSLERSPTSKWIPGSTPERWKMLLWNRGKEAKLTYYLILYQNQFFHLVDFIIWFHNWLNLYTFMFYLFIVVPLVFRRILGSKPVTDYYLHTKCYWHYYY